ncbi:hypothetical protein LN040_03995 [Desulfovibrio subterraneus]|uniref:hypothetical protein n=1 Tax=Desulfovibrio subterraneus TaxID=2718620 RepID=UPI0022B90FAB|nr:hypothetical protein [Desulfovibrio subterraneus]WBF68276.1 hypothetical protein LN040_03995 [Desulfovibrio subterraneus]
MHVGLALAQAEIAIRSEIEEARRCLWGTKALMDGVALECQRQLEHDDFIGDVEGVDEVIHDFAHAFPRSFMTGWVAGTYGVFEQGCRMTMEMAQARWTGAPRVPQKSHMHNVAEWLTGFGAAIGDVEWAAMDNHRLLRNQIVHQGREVELGRGGRLIAWIGGTPHVRIVDNNGNDVRAGEGGRIVVERSYADMLCDDCLAFFSSFKNVICNAVQE